MRYPALLFPPCAQQNAKEAEWSARKRMETVERLVSLSVRCTQFHRRARKRMQTGVGTATVDPVGVNSPVS
jgi:hypothetical protein